jgi:DNA-directed RNA polymerase specialized sigma24 family protein
MSPGSLQPATKTKRPVFPMGPLPRSGSGSVTHLICRVKQGDADAAQELFTRYSRRLLGLARAKLQGKHLRVGDEEDVVNTALAGFFLGAARGQYTQLHDRNDLWHLLVKITVRKAKRLVEEQERQKRRPGGPRPGIYCRGWAGTLRGAIPVEQIADPKPPPDLEVLANERIEDLLSRLGDGTLRSIAVWKWQHYSNEEIASMLGCCARTIGRKLELIRTIWNNGDAGKGCRYSERAPTCHAS